MTHTSADDDPASTSCVASILSSNWRVSTGSLLSTTFKTRETITGGDDKGSGDDGSGDDGSGDSTPALGAVGTS